MIALDNNLLKVQAFVKAVECGSFTRAAEALGYTQSSVSKMIADLEQVWRVSLLERSRGGVQITADGLALLPYARTLIHDYRALQEQVAELNGLQRGLIRIGTFSSVATHWMPNIIKAFQKDYPNIEYELLLGDYGEIEQWIGEGRVECGFLRLPTRTELDCISLEKDELAVVMPMGHALAAKTAVDPSDLNGQPFMLLEHGGKTEVSELLERYHLKPRILFTSWDDYAILAMVEGGFGLAILPRLILRRIPYAVEIRPLSVDVHREIGLAMRSRRAASPAVKHFIQYLDYR